MAATATPKGSPHGNIVLVACFSFLILGAIFYLRLSSTQRVDPSTRSGPSDDLLIVRRTDGGSIAVVVLSGNDHSPIAGAQVTYGSEATPQDAEEGRHVTTDTSGRALLEGSGRGFLVVTAPDHVGITTSVVFEPGEFTVVLPMPGSLVIEIVGEDGIPVSGVEVSLFPPIPQEGNPKLGEASPETHLLWEDVTLSQKSGVDGRILWPKLIPASGYKYHIVSGQLVKSAQPSSITIESSQRSRGKIVLLYSASISGTLLIGTGEGEIDLSTREVEVPGSKILGLLTESIIRIAPPGEFHFKRVKPGRKRIKAWWKEPPNRYRFVHIEFDLAPNEHKHLGVLSPTTGHRVEGVVRLIGSEHLPGQLKESPPEAIVRVGNWPPPPVSPEGMIAEQIYVPMNEPFTLEGLMAGQLLLGASLDLRERRHPVKRFSLQGFAAERLMPGVQLRNAPSESYPVPETTHVEMKIILAAKISVRVAAYFPAGSRPGPLRIGILPTPPSSGRVVLSDLGAPDGSTPRDVWTTVDVPAGEYKIWVFSATSTHNYFGEAAVTAGPGGASQVTIELGPGVTIKGTIVSQPGKSASRPQHLAFQPEGFGGNVPYVCPVAADGSFTLTGVPPGARLKVVGHQTTLQAGAAGTETHVRIE